MSCSYGCFEQTSSVAYPLVMAQQYFLSHRGVDPKIIEDAKKNLQKSYDRLKGFEVKTAGVIPSGGFGTCSVSSLSTGA